MEIIAYNLPDVQLLEDSSSTYRTMIWEPEFPAIILGQSNKAHESLFIDKVVEDHIPVYKRPSGGETVVISPNTIIISILKRGDELISPTRYFHNYNETIIAALEKMGIENLHQDGISDICIQEKKILGSSIYRNKDRVLYHAVLNRAETGAVIAMYLKHPLREPAYRRGRKHGEFVTSLKEMGYELPGEVLKEALSSHLKEITWI